METAGSKKTAQTPRGARYALVDSINHQQLRIKMNAENFKAGTHRARARQNVHALLGGIETNAVGLSPIVQ
eukprot:5676088-Pyramimonas_sp.AAC.1